MENTNTKKLFKRIALSLLAVIITAGVILTGIWTDGFRTWNEPLLQQTSDVSNETGNTDGEAYPMPKNMSFTAKTLAAALAEGQTADVRVKAIVSPYDAANTAVDFSVAWGSAPTNGSLPVTDFVTVTPDSDGSVNATVSCKKAFGNDKIIVTVTTRDGGYTAHCTVSFVGVASEMSVTNTSVNPIRDDKRGTYYELGSNKTYTFDINLNNVFNEVGSKNLTVTVGGVGSLYFGKTYSDSMSGIARFSDMQKRTMSEMADKFITSATVGGTTLTIKTGTKLVENYYSYSESDEYYTGTYTYDRFVYEDEFGLTVGDKIADDYEGKAKENTAALPSCYFTVTVKDTVSGLSDTIRIWIVSSVSGVRFEKTELMI